MSSWAKLYTIFTRSVAKLSGVFAETLEITTSIDRNVSLLQRKPKPFPDSTLTIVLKLMVVADTAAPIMYYSKALIRDSKQIFRRCLTYLTVHGKEFLLQ